MFENITAFVKTHTLTGTHVETFLCGAEGEPRLSCTLSQCFTTESHLQVQEEYILSGSISDNVMNCL